ncbi:MAG: TonB-dependent receptor, partial [Kangiellaceae bacterium]|nr:TonB-dependent receptor [Kangiellaceae bacterium]
LFYTVSLFDSTIENLIQWTPDSNGIWSPGNVGKAEISGLNFSATIRDDELTHKFTASFVDAKDAATDEQLIRRAKKKMTYDLIASHGAFETFVQAQYVGDRPDSDYQTFEATQLDNYFQINVGVGYEFNSNWKVNLKVNDLTREEPVQVSGYRPLEEEVYLSVTYQNLN